MVPFEAISLRLSNPFSKKGGDDERFWEVKKILFLFLKRKEDISYV